MSDFKSKKTIDGKTARVSVLAADRRPVFRSSDLLVDDETFMTFLMKTEKGKDSSTRQGASLGEKYPPFDMDALKEFTNWNVHHSRSLLTKVACTVGLGFVDAGDEKMKTEAEAGMLTALPEDAAGFMTKLAEANNRLKLSKAEEVLNPLCDVSLQDLLTSFAFDRWCIGQGYLEVVRAPNDETIIGLHWVPGQTIRPFLEDDKYNVHYIQHNMDGAGSDRRFAKFGDLKGFKSRAASGSTIQLPKDARVSELIVWRGPLTLNRWYSYPDYLSCVPIIELAQMLTQHEFDFFQNRGVPEFLLFLIGKEIDAPEWEEIENVLRAGIGLRNQHKSAAINIKDAGVEVLLEKLAMESKGGDSNTDKKTQNALDIVTAHGVPPLLGNIVVPGKMGAANELPNAILGFQSLLIGPEQRSLWNILAKTLGGEQGIEGLTAEDFRLRAITEEFDLGKADTMARMKTPAAQAQAQGRDLGQGLKERGGDNKGEGK